MLPRNGHAVLNGSNGSSGDDGHLANGSPFSPFSETAEQARQMTALVLSLTRQLLAVDDQAAELPLRQLRVCMVLHDGPRSMSALSRELGVSLSAMTQIADRLERAGLVKRSFEGSDRRVRSLQLTPRGQKIMQMREQTRIKRVSTVVERMSPQSRKEVLTSLNVLLSACK